MKPRHKSVLWSEARQRREFAEAVQCVALVLLIAVLVAAWVLHHDPHEQVAHASPPPCRMINNTQGFCPRE